MSWVNEFGGFRYQMVSCRGRSASKQKIWRGQGAVGSSVQQLDALDVRVDGKLFGQKLPGAGVAALVFLTAGAQNCSPRSPGPSTAHPGVRADCVP
jgi:hypothetical protein